MSGLKSLLGSRAAYVAGGLAGALLLAFVPWVLATHTVRIPQATKSTIRVGYFPNVTHVHALVALNFSRHGQDWFAERLQGQATVEWHPFNAGPSAMASLIAGSLDMGYAGPSSVINAYALSKGSQVRLVAGAVTGGSALVVQPGSGLLTPEKFKGRSIATPEFGNTQDITARAWLSSGGLQPGRDVQVVPMPNPEQLKLFRLMAIDAAWTVEPWVSRLELLADATVVVEEKSSPTTVLAANAQFLTKRRQLADAFVAGHRDLTTWINAHPQEAQRMLTEELQARFATDMPATALSRAWQRIHVTSDVSKEVLGNVLQKAKDAGFVTNLDIAGLFDTGCGRGHEAGAQCLAQPAELLVQNGH